MLEWVSFLLVVDLRPRAHIAILGQLILGLRPLLLPLDEKRPLGRQFQRGTVALLLFSLLPLHNALIVTDGGSISTLIPEIEMRHPFHLHLPTFFDQACLTIRSVDLQTVVFTLAVQ